MSLNKLREVKPAKTRQFYVIKDLANEVVVYEKEFLKKSVYTEPKLPQTRYKRFQFETVKEHNEGWHG